MRGGIGPVAGSTPYPWPWDGGCPGGQLALVVAGWDDGWRARAAEPAVAPAEAAVEALMVGVDAAGGMVVTVGHPPPPRPTSDSGLWISRSAERSRAQNAGIAAAGIDGFHGSGLDAALRRAPATHLLLAGHGLEGPVHSTLRSANDRGYECLLVIDACSPLDPDLAGAARSMVEMSGGIFGAVGITADVLAALVAAPAPAPTPVTT